MFGKCVQGYQSGILIYRSINCLQVRHELFQILVGHILGGVPNLVDNAVLNLSLGVHCPIFGALVFTDPHAQDIFSTLQIDANGDVHCLLYNPPFTPDVEVDRIQKYHGIDTLQGPLLPLFGLRQDLIRDSADGGI